MLLKLRSISYGAPIYVRKEIVHNRHVVDELREAGAVFVDELAEVPAGRARDLQRARCLTRRAGRSQTARQLEVIDATCPLVTKVHLEAIKFARQGYTIILIGHQGSRRSDRHSRRSARTRPCL